MFEAYTSTQLLTALLFTLISLSILTKTKKIANAFRDLGSCPGRGLLWAHPFHPFSQIVASVYPLKGWIGHYFDAFSMYERYGSACISSVLVSKSKPIYWLADAQAMKTVATDKASFDKDMGFYNNGLNFFGPNIVASETKPWRRHRTVSNPAFNESVNAIVWKETAIAVGNWFAEIDSEDGDIPIHTFDSFSKLALVIFARAGFGSDGSTSMGELLEVIRKANHYSAARGVLPDWIFKLTNWIYIPLISPYLRATIKTYNDLERISMSVVSKARADVLELEESKLDSTTSGALLRSLVKANMDMDDEKDEKDRDRRSLTDRELLSDMWVFFTAGHETTANTVSFVCVFLALYPDIQRKVFNEVQGIWPDGVPKEVNEEDYKNTFSKLVYTTAVIHEALRLNPIVSRLGRDVLQDTVLKSYRFNGTSDPEPYIIPMKKGSKVIIDIAAVHRNPIYWGADANTFRPERFIDTNSYRWPRDAFLAFSTGFRNCIGQKFAMAEGVNILARIVRTYEILVPKHLEYKSLDEQKAYLLEWRPLITNSPVHPEVTLRKRLH